MKSILDEYKSLMLELFLTSMVILMILELGNLGSSAVNKKRNDDSNVNAITQYREIHKYDNAEVTGNDIIMIISEFSDLYSYYFDLPNGQFAIRPICVYYPNEDYSEHIHTSTDTRKCVKGWFVDDLNTKNYITYSSYNGNVVASGCEGGVSETIKKDTYSISTISSVIGKINMTSLYRCTIKRYNYDEMVKNITDPVLLESYERRKNDIIGFSFKGLY